MVRWAALVGGLIGVSVHGALAQRVAATETCLGATAIAANRDFWGVELGIARRPGGQARVAVTAAVGSAAGAVAFRLHTTAQFVLKPAARTGVTPYAGVGLAFAAAQGTAGAGYVAALIGVERAPGRRRGWYVELGVGGGIWAAAGVRLRRLPGWW